MLEFLVDQLLYPPGFLVEMGQLARAFQPGLALAPATQGELLLDSLCNELSQWNSQSARRGLGLAKGWVRDLQRRLHDPSFPYLWDMLVWPKTRRERKRSSSAPSLDTFRIVIEPVIVEEIACFAPRLFTAGEHQRGRHVEHHGANGDAAEVLLQEPSFVETRETEPRQIYVADPGQILILRIGCARRRSRVRAETVLPRRRFHTSSPGRPNGRESG